MQITNNFQDEADYITTHSNPSTLDDRNLEESEGIIS